MMREQTRFAAVWGRALALAGAALAFYGCTGDPPTSEIEDHVMPAPTPTPAAAEASTSISQLPFVTAAANQQLLGELMTRTTALGETTALHVRLPPPRNPQLRNSLVRIVGDPDSPQLLFRSDALRQLGVVGSSPGSDFFTAFSTLTTDELTKLEQSDDTITKGGFGTATTESIVFNGRNAIARTSNPKIDPTAFRPGIAIPINRCRIRPIGTQAAWDKSLFIRDPAVVLDPLRTWDPCTGAGTQGGVWTFAHLIREMAIGSGLTAENFVKEWLTLWLNNQVINGDTVVARLQMFNQVIAPWATASGVVATLVTDATGKRSVNLTGPLNLNIAPFRLLAIVNRIDLGETKGGGGGYGGSTTGTPVTAGELRFIFNVVQPNPWGAGTEATCGRKLFTTIFEYGVPRRGCNAVVNWAKQWSSLQAFPGFTPAYLAQLQAMTQSVVLHGAAPAKGNQNAINQIRTNEIALASPWELREFTLTAENPPANVDPPANGPLRVHTVAQTPNDGVFSPLGADPTINNFVQNVVIPSVTACTTGIAGVTAGFTVPFFHLGAPFRAGNALVMTPPPFGAEHWRANSVTAASPFNPDKCGRFAFSLNTCHGCHQDDSGTNGFGGSTFFTHIDVFTSPPVTMSKFLTGGGPGLVFNVPDSQFVAPAWSFADLERRFQRLFDLAHCTPCTTIRPMKADVITAIQSMGPVPIDPAPGVAFPEIRVGPITDLANVQKILDLRGQFAGAAQSEPADFIRTFDPAPH
jgi:hypothetical protein